MSFIIEDGHGSGYKAKVDESGKLRTYAVTEREISHESEDHGRAYIWAASADWGADKNAIWLRNDSTSLRLQIEELVVTAPTACVVENFIGTGNTVGGTEVVGTNLNRNSGSTANATCRHTNTNVDAGAGMTLLSHGLVAANTIQKFEVYGALILGYNDEVAINLVTDVGTAYLYIVGYYHG